MFKGIRDERGVARNTAVRIGTAFLELLRATLSDSRDFDNITFKNVLNKPNFLQGLVALGSIIFGEYAEGIRGGYIDENAVGELKRLWVREQITAGDGVSHYDAGGKVLQALEVKGDSTFSGNLSSPEFVSDFLGGLGWAIQKKEFTNAAGQTEEKFTLEIDNIVVRNTLRVFEMIISQLMGENDNRIFTAMMEVDHYDPKTGRVWLDTKGGSLYNAFREGDLIMVQQFNGTPDQSNDWQVIKAYEFRVRKVGVGSLVDGVERLDWLEFDNFVSQIEGLTPETAFKSGDTLVRVDSESDPARKGIVTIMTVGENMPYIDVMYGLKTDPTHALKSRMGNLSGVNTDLFGWLEGFGLYINNFYGVGKFFNAQTGESLSSRIAATNEYLRSVYKETIYDISDDQNFITNGFFQKDLETWQKCDASGNDLVDSATSVIGINTGDGASPLLFNGMTLTANSSPIAGMVEREGLNVLHLRAAGIYQSFANIKANGTHKVLKEKLDEDDTELVDEANQLFFGIRILPVTGGTLSVHFVKEDGYTGFEREITSALRWQLFQMNDIVELPWDYTGTGKMVITYTGECYIRFVTLSNDPIANAKTEYSTLIEQTSRYIKLQAKKQSKDLQDAVADMTIQYDAIVQTVSTNKSLSDTMLATVLGITVNEDGTYTIPEELSGTNLATWRINTAGSIHDIAIKWDEDGNLIGYSTTKQTAEAISSAVADGVSDAEDYTDGEITKAKKSAKDYTDELKALINTDVLKDADGNFGYATFKQQTKDSIDAIAGKWDENGNLIGYSTTKQTADAISSAVTDGVSDAEDYTDTEITKAKKSAKDYTDELKGLINTDVLKDSDGNFGYATFKQQTQDSIDAIAGKWDEDGHLIGYSTTKQTAKAISTAVSGKADSSALDDYLLTSTWTQEKDSINASVKAIKDDYVKSADISAFIKDEDGVWLSHIKLKADRIDFITDGWTVKNSSDVTTLQLDKNGNLTIKGKINGGSIEGTLSVASNTNFEVSGTKFARFASSKDMSAMLALRNDGGNCIQIGSYDTGGVALSINANANAKVIEAYGPNEFYLRTDEYFQIQNYSGTGYFALGAAVKNTSFTLPANPKDGTIFFIHGARSENGVNQDLTITTRSHPIMESDGRGNAVNAYSSHNYTCASAILVYFAALSKWVLYNCW